MKRALMAVLLSALFGFCSLSFADDSKPYKDGPVTEVSYIKVKVGHFDEYMAFLDNHYKKEMEAYKKAGLITGYAVYAGHPRSPSEPDLLLTVTYPNMAALDKTEQFEAVSVKVSGSMDDQNKGAASRDSIREILGSELIRELILK